MVCPSCRVLCGDDQTFCPGCGVDFLRWARKGRASVLRPETGVLLAGPDRAVTPWLRLNLLFGGSSNWFGWPLLCVGLACATRYAAPDPPSGPGYVLSTASLLALGLGLVAREFRRGMASVRLLRRGVLAEGRPIARRGTYEFAAGDGSRVTVKARGTAPERAEEPLVYDPDDPRDAVVLSALPGRPRIGAGGAVSSDGSWLPALLLVPALALPAYWYPRTAPQPRTPPAVERVSRPAVAAELHLSLVYDGRPFTPPEGSRVTFWAREEAANKGLTLRSAPVRDGYALSGFGTGRHSLTARVLAPRDSPPYTPRPGDWEGGLTLPAPGGSAQVELRRVIHLMSPADNAASLGRHQQVCTPAAATHPGPVVFEWEPLEPGAEYSYEVQAVRCPYAGHRAVASGTLTGTSVSVPLPPSAEGEYYLFTVGARRSGRPIGKLCTFGENWNGWDYRFRVAP